MGVSGVLNSLGYGRELKVTVIGGKSDEEKLAQAINDWLGQHAMVDVVEIQYRYGINGNIGWYSAMIVYRGV